MDEKFYQKCANTMSNMVIQEIKKENDFSPVLVFKELAELSINLFFNSLALLTNDKEMFIKMANEIFEMSQEDFEKNFNKIQTNKDLIVVLSKMFNEEK